MAFVVTNELRKVAVWVRFNSRAKGLTYEKEAVLNGHNKYYNSAIDELKLANGELRRLGMLTADIFPPRGEIGLSYFRVTDEGIPIVAIERKVSRAMIEHEMQHFRDWNAMRLKFISEGFSPLEAALKSKKFYFTPSKVRQTEFNAVKEELKYLNATVLDVEFLRRIVYPEIATIVKTINFQQLTKKKMSSKTKRLLNSFMDKAISKAIRIRRLRQ